LPGENQITTASLKTRHNNKTWHYAKMH
jgi:hypothetical protein